MLRLTTRRSKEALPLANRHYNRRSPESDQFVPPGRCVVLLGGHPVNVLWVSSWQGYAFHAWPGAWVCTLFRNEGPRLSSEIIREAVAHTRWAWGKPPPEGLITFVDPGKVRRKRDPGRCYRKAGFQVAGTAPGRNRQGLVVLQMKPDAMPAPAPPLRAQLKLFPELSTSAGPFVDPSLRGA